MSANRIPRRKLLLIDTCVLVEIVGVPFESDHSSDLRKEFDEHRRNRAEIRIPLVTVLETGSHIRKIDDGEERKYCAHTFVTFLRHALEEKPPWKFGKFQWDETVIRRVLDGEEHGYPLERSIGDGTFEIGDLTIIKEWRAGPAPSEAPLLSLVA